MCDLERSSMADLLKEQIERNLLKRWQIHSEQLLLGGDLASQPCNRRGSTWRAAKAVSVLHPHRQEMLQL